MARSFCTHHCSDRYGCGQHFRGLGAFDAHLKRVSEGPNADGARSYELTHLEGAEAGLEAWVTDGWCSLRPGPDVQGVTVWHLPLSEADRERLAAIGQDADSEQGSSRSGREEPSDVSVDPAA